jgi:hypothetical protein
MDGRCGAAAFFRVYFIYASLICNGAHKWIGGFHPPLTVEYRRNESKAMGHGDHVDLMEALEASAAAARAATVGRRGQHPATAAGNTGRRMAGGGRRARRGQGLAHGR